MTAVIFDFDGVLADTEPLHLRAFQAVLADRGITLTDTDYYASYLGLDDAGVFDAIARDRGQPIATGEVRALVARKAAVMKGLIGETSTLYPAAATCVLRLANSSIPLAIASGALRHEIEMILNRGGLLQHFMGIVAGGEAERSKPAPDPYLQALAVLGAAASSSVAIEDSRWGVEAAAAAGMKTVAITHTYPAAELSDADAIIASLDELTIERLRAVVEAR